MIWQCPRCAWSIPHIDGTVEVWHLCNPPGRPAKNIRCNLRTKDDAA